MRGGGHALAGDDRRAARELEVAIHGPCGEVTLCDGRDGGYQERGDDTDAGPSSHHSRQDARRRAREEAQAARRRGGRRPRALRAYAEEDGNPILRSRIASGKAFGAVAFGTGSRRLHQIGIERPHMAAALVEMTGGALVPVPGGVLIRDKRAPSSARWAYPATPPTTTRPRRWPASRRRFHRGNRRLRLHPTGVARPGPPLAPLASTRRPLAALEHDLLVHRPDREAGDHVDEAQAR